MPVATEISWLFSAGIFLVAIGMAQTIFYFAARDSENPQALSQRGDRYVSIEGLRGVAAIFVYISHLASHFAKIYEISQAKSFQVLHPVFSHMGRNSVDVFFMITGFLFASKLLDCRNNHFNWLRLYISRFFRLVPLYAFAITLIFVVIGFQTDWLIRTSIEDCLISASKWLAFTIPGHPAINGFDAQVLGSVTWSLTDEWKFYFSLPAIGLALSVKSPKLLVFFSLMVFAFWHPHGFILCSFLGGITAAYISRTRWAELNFKRTAFSILVILLIYCAVSLSPLEENDEVVSTIFISIVFWIIAAGNTMFGVLSNPATKVLGQMAYSVYLLHLTLIYLLMDVVWKDVSIQTYYLVSVLVCTPLLVISCYATYKFIESPFMSKTDAISRKLQVFLK